ncbi:trypsin domain-containing protein [Ditylenchus destructor]|uniref:Trypsin domain-containing protein n=1 Tax=Ditylenchus destructor TaxID=166010 RepID=A0AAD4MZE5_9BILA|nr:trypsin domain-containing protein [Ditylenchus destructor]
MGLCCISFFLILLAPFICCGNEYKFRPVSREYNAELQANCANPQFADSEAVRKVQHGAPAPKGKYPWAVAMVSGPELSSYCGGTLISPRHIITARHCIETLHSRSPFLIKVGGVCHSEAPDKNCPKSDMREVKIEFAAYEPSVKDPKNPYDPSQEIVVKNWEHDMAIIQLKEDLVQHLGSNKNASDDTHVACLPQLKEKIPSEMNVYGWGKTDKGYFSPRLMEVKLYTLDTAHDPINNKSSYTQSAVAKGCNSDRLYCMHPKDINSRADGGYADSGTGIIGRRGPLSIFFGSTIAGPVENGPFVMNVATKTQKFEYDICYYTGVCTEKAWVGKADEKKVTVKLRAFYDPSKPKNVETK